MWCAGEGGAGVRRRAAGSSQWRGLEVTCCNRKGRRARWLLARELSTGADLPSVDMKILQGWNTLARHSAALMQNEGIELLEIRILLTRGSCGSQILTLWAEAGITAITPPHHIVFHLTLLHAIFATSVCPEDVCIRFTSLSLIKVVSECSV